MVNRDGRVAQRKLRRGSYFPSFLKPRRLAEKALTTDLGGLHPRHLDPSVDELVTAIDMSGISKSQTARSSEEIDRWVKAFLNRPIEGDRSYLWIGAPYAKMRQGGRIISVAVIVTARANADGRRKVLSMNIGPSEAETL